MQEFPFAIFELTGYSDCEREEAAHTLSVLSQSIHLPFFKNDPGWAERSIEQLSEKWIGSAWRQIALHGGSISMQFYKSGVLAYGAEMVPYHKILRAVETARLYILLLEDHIVVLQKSGMIEGTDLAFRTYLEEQGVKADTFEWFSAN